MKRLIPLGIVFLTIFTLLGCSKESDVTTETNKKTLPGGTPPTLTITVNGEETKLDVYDFCWNNCENVGSLNRLNNDLIKSKNPKTLNVAIGSEVSILINKPKPSSLDFDSSYRYDAGLSQKENYEIKDNKIIIPTEEGIHYYFIRAKWIDNQHPSTSVRKGESYYGPIAFQVTAN
ncbi:hypothetical protein BGM26_13950 [Bacillus sp. FJAT-29790]|uniref:hypothetical protein n=1 Tax=Bacillus sp. FJAT-29790 TaxID=1895002 RepID=UPI001C23AFC3|nr:hypothetical protein [Bacillus sp. FJAT-29790]MBU8880081.1 hypothetical protein [Bacillus sp. FJAT-29790]